MAISSLQTALADFARQRDWEQFHTPKNLVMALVGEAGELAAEFQWLTADESGSVMDHPQRSEAVRQEMADVLSYLLRLADVLDVDIEQALRDKMALNDAKYPVERSRGSAAKYTAYRERP